jgi:hypothetical protein
VGNYGEVDHKEPIFQKLVDSFLNEHCNGKKPAFEVDVPTPRLVDRAIASKWHSFHKERATLQLLTRAEHKQKTSVDMRSYRKKKSERSCHSNMMETTNIVTSNNSNVISNTTTTRPPITAEQRARIEVNRLAALQRKRIHKRKIEADRLAAHERQHKK